MENETTAVENRETSDLAPASGGDAQSDVVIESRNLSKIYRDFWGRKKVHALKSLDIEVRTGEIFGLLGPNGSGKSTTIKLILGLLFPSSGRVLVFDKDASETSKNERIGYLPEESYLYKFLTAEETLDFYGRLFNMSGAERKQRVDQLVRLVGLQGAKHRQLREYSKGMTRRVGLAQALINDPDLILLDEPTTGLDPIGTREMKDLILGLRDQGKTILLCSHQLADVQDVCDRVAILDRGSLKFVGSITDLTPSAETDLQLRLVGNDDVIRAACEMAELNLTRLEDDVFQLQITVPDQGAADALVDRLRQHGVSIVQLVRRKKTLEDAFLELITEKAELV